MKLVETVSEEITASAIPTELLDKKISDIVTAKENIAKRINGFLPSDKKAKEQSLMTINELQGLLKKIKNPQVAIDKKLSYEITERLDLSIESAEVYDTIMQAIKDFFTDDEELFERLVKKIHSSLERNFENDR